ncbi:DUF1963 domain-containing protein [Bacillus sp. RG28]|uniref:DUF1963 domain-containing protein n=1 Tax=Gottfriedia endophytica TaxID=2820819 RepID=A0A940NKY2_9BACI|nr:YwqG family protein [Gottfriedia endophytica]MBP0724431.1 DUF1963 domain-containing protein [Gottfriedia endophytica]
MKITIPNQLQHAKEIIEKSVRPLIRVTAKKSKTALFQSKFGGDPYLPIGFDHPCDAENIPMMLLAQLNFEEFPALEHFPAKGILQFYISQKDDVYGLDFDDPTSQKNFRVIYHSDITNDLNLLRTDFSYMEIGEDYLPFEGEYALEFQLDSEYISMTDYRFEMLTDGVIDLDEEVEVNGEITDMWELCSDIFDGSGHKIGGYPYFTQTDPREYQDDTTHEILLLQIDTDDENDIMWGDCGVANFFISKEDLEKLDFSHVLYNWDCS